MDAQVPQQQGKEVNMNNTFGKVLVGCAVIAAAGAGASFAVVAAGPAAPATMHPSAATVSAANGVATAANPVTLPAPAAVGDPAAVSEPDQAPLGAAAPRVGGRAYPMAPSATSTANCPHMGSRHGTETPPTSTVTPPAT
jgi:hypothetical protein